MKTRATLAAIAVLAAQPALADRYTCAKPGDAETIIEFDRAQNLLFITEDSENIQLERKPACEAFKAILTPGFGEAAVAAMPGRCSIAIGAKTVVTDFFVPDGQHALALTFALDTETLMLTSIGRFGAREGFVESAPCRKS